LGLFKRRFISRSLEHTIAHHGIGIAAVSAQPFAARRPIPRIQLRFVAQDIIELIPLFAVAVPAVVLAVVAGSSRRCISRKTATAASVIRLPPGGRTGVRLVLMVVAILLAAVAVRPASRSRS